MLDNLSDITLSASGRNVDKGQMLLIKFPSGTYMLRIMNNIQSMLGFYILDVTGSRVNILKLSEYSSLVTVSASSSDTLKIENQLHIVSVAILGLNRNVNLNNINISLKSI